MLPRISRLLSTLRHCRSTSSITPHVGPLSEIKVLELASVLAGPSVSQFLAELGANVVKVENSRTNGDVTRGWKLPTESREGDLSAYFSSCNWGKRSLAVDLSQTDGREVVQDLAAECDVVVVRPPHNP